MQLANVTRHAIVENAGRCVYKSLHELPSELQSLCIDAWKNMQQFTAWREFAALPVYFCSDLGINAFEMMHLSQLYIWLTFFFRIQDQAIDRDPPIDYRLLLCENIFLGKICQLVQEFPSYTFQVLEKTFQEYSQATAFEISRYKVTPPYQINQRVLTFRDIEFLGRKFSPLSIPLAAAVLASGKQSLDPVYDLINNYGIALQMRNDLLDWKQDYERGQMTYVLSLLIKATGNTTRWPEYSDLLPVFTQSNIIQDILTIECVHYVKSAVSASTISPSLKNFFSKKASTTVQDLKVMNWKKLHADE
jgi:hypothetical protein